MNKKKPFCHLHTHTEYSLLDGALRIKDLINRVKQNGMSSVSVTDHGSMYGVIDFYKAAKKAGIKPIIGCEVYVTPGSRFSKSSRKDTNLYHLVLLAENNLGYKNLVKLVTRSFTEGYYYKPRVDKELLNQYSDGLIALSACLSGEIPKKIIEVGAEEAKKSLLDYLDIFGKENFYLELQYHRLKEQDKVNQQLIKFSKQMDVELVCSNDAHYLTRNDRNIHDILLHIQTGTTMEDDLKLGFSTDEFYVKTPQEMWAIFEDQKKSLLNTVEIARRCNVNLEFGNIILPEYEVPEKHTLDSYLEHLCYEGAKKRYGNISREVEERLNRELNAIKSAGFSGYFLIVWDVINWAKSNGIRVGPGRGSAAGSIVAYTLGISDIDPLQFDLLFERFLNPSRQNLPDIDIDFAEDKREEIIEYVRNKYGEDKVAQIITFSTMKARAATRDAGRALNYSYSYVDKIAKQISHSTIDESLQQVKDLKQMYDTDENARKVLDAAKGLEGLVRQDSIHAAGIVISKDPLTDVVPLQQKGESEIVTQFSMKPISDIGLLKMDFLGLRTLTVIENSLRFIKERYNKEIDLSTIDLNDKKVFELLQNGNTVGVFQLERIGMREMLKELKPTNFEDIIAANALNRPGPLKSGMVTEFINRKHERQKIKYPHPALEPVLKQTYGTIIYQEQVMAIASRLANYSMEEADSLRQAISKKIAGQFEAEREKFINGAVKNGVDRKVAEDIFKTVLHFSEYAFNKSHSAAYALVAYQTAWLKAHYPVEFLTALLTSVRDDKDKIALYVNEAKRMNINVLPPDVNYSKANFYPEDDNSIRFGLATVRNVGDSAAASIIKARQEKPFTTIFDFALRVDSSALNKRCIESLIKAGAFNSMGYSRKRLIDVYEAAVDQATKRKRAIERGQFSLFGDSTKPTPEEEKVFAPNGEDEYPREFLLRNEKEYLGAYITEHPVSSYLSTFKGKCSHTTTEALEEKDKTEVLIGGIIVKVKTMLTRRGNQTAIITLEDLEGQIRCRIWPNVLENNRELIREENVIMVKGKVDIRDEGQQPVIIADSVHSPEEKVNIKNVVKKKPKTLHLTFEPKYASTKTFRKILKQLLTKYPGDCRVLIHLEHDGKIKTIKTNNKYSVEPTSGMIHECKHLLKPKKVEVK